MSTVFNENLRLVLTDDGSHTVYVPSLDEHYHSRFGAVAESLHIFVHAGLNSLEKTTGISVFEIGFGTGLNALLTCIEAERQKRPVLYHSVEKFPLETGFAGRLNHSEWLSGSGLAEDTANKIHDAGWNMHVPVTQFFTLHKIKADFTTFQPDFMYDLVFFDAFAPEKQPEMWQTENFSGIFGRMNPNGILVTYCSKGQVKRDLRETGFLVEVLPGPPGKRHMIRARKPPV